MTLFELSYERETQLQKLENPTSIIINTFKNCIFINKNDKYTMIEN